MRTYDNPRRDCIYWLNNGLNTTDYDFFYWERRRPRPSSWNNGVAGKIHKHAKIGYLDEVPYPAMVIRAHYEKEEHARVYLLLYWSESEKCFILLHPADVEVFAYKGPCAEPDFSAPEYSSAVFWV
ncbi:hypothetical protein MRX96_046728 [Rhipicephalus microplus]